MARTDCPHKLSNQTREGGHRNAYIILMESKPSVAQMGDTVRFFTLKRQKKLHLAMREDDVFGKNLKHQLSTSVVTAGDLEEQVMPHFFLSSKLTIINR